VPLQELVGPGADPAGDDHLRGGIAIEVLERAARLGLAVARLGDADEVRERIPREAGLGARRIAVDPNDAQ
jgi:hypothetical protein